MAIVFAKQASKLSFGLSAASMTFPPFVFIGVFVIDNGVIFASRIFELLTSFHVGILLLRFLEKWV